MDDRELLEAAARAAGMSGTTVDYDDRLVFLEDGKPASIEWNPLTDDGDALRLAVKLNLNVWCGRAGVGVNDGEIPTRNRFASSEPWGDDKMAATRLAIVRAAAALTSQEPHP